jgi:hypothetical protein
MLCFLLLPVLASAGEMLIEGRVFTESGPLRATVSAFRTYADLQQDSAPFATAIADIEGRYQLPVPSGTYYLAARAESGGRRYFAYHGNNPLNVSSENVWLTLMASPVDAAPRYSDGTTGIEGIITYKGKPLDKAYLAIYKPDSRTFKGLGVKTESIKADGRFKVDLQPGSYVVTARKIASGKSNRPLQKGDLYCYYANNPVDVREKQTTHLELTCYPKVDREDFVNSPKVKSNHTKNPVEIAAASKFGIRGVVLDENGRPVSGMSVLAYRLSAPVFMMYHIYHGTEFSAETNSQGEFFIPLDQDGDYGVVARDTLGDGPHRGERYGLYQGNVRHAVTFKQGEQPDKITISTGIVMDLPPSTEKRTVPEIIVGTPSGKPITLGDTVISKDTIWQGEFIIQGVISVKRGATLTIRPGTMIRFKKIDRDHNNVGDGEILIEGRLIAQGTADQRIIFTSAEANPDINDWSYLQFLASNKGNIIEHCHFEYAFSGIMIHYADVKISDTVFQNNNRGLHYNTADLKVDHCTFVNNRIGIRFMRMEGDVLVSNNEISRNEVGILFVRQHVNAVDFDKLNRGKELPRFENNNISGNSSYNFSLGEEQDRDIAVPGNWWGSSQRETISEEMFDGGKSGDMRQIHFEPFLKSAVVGAGARHLKPGTIGRRQTAQDNRGIDRTRYSFISGRFIFADAAPSSGSLLYLYNLSSGPIPSQDRYWRVPNLAMEIGADGRFSTPVPPGEYSVAAILRADQVRIGPPEAGDVFMISEDETGKPKQYVVKAGRDLDVGEIRQPTRRPAQAVLPHVTTAITGRITDYDEKPLEGVMVFAFATPVTIGKPLFVSGPSDKDGTFRLQLFEGGTFYLKTRSELGGGPPQTGNLIDGNKLEEMVPVSVKSGETIRGIVLKTKRFPGRGRNKDL